MSSRPAPTDVEPSVAALLAAIASVGAAVRHVVLPTDQSDERSWGAELTLTDASTIRCDARTALAVARLVGVPA